MILFDIGIIKFRNQEVGGSTPLSGIVKSIGYVKTAVVFNYCVAHVSQFDIEKNER